MQRSDPQMRIRIPLDVKLWIEMHARQNYRTQNSEIIVALRAQMEVENKKSGTQA